MLRELSSDPWFKFDSVLGMGECESKLACTEIDFASKRLTWGVMLDNFSSSEDV